MAELKVGDVVAYKASWLKSTQAGAEFAAARGTIIAFSGREMMVAHINWGLHDVPGKVHIGNLAKRNTAAFSDPSS